MEISIQWNKGKETTFQMLVVPGLSWPKFFFGENHLHSTQALVDHVDPSIHFRHPNMSFKIACSLQNPLLEASHRGSNTHAGVLSDPFHLTAATEQLLPDVSCYASVCDLPSSSSETISEHIISDFQSPFTTTIAAECKCKQTDIPQNVILGHLRPIQEEDLQVYEDAAENTANILSESMVCWANGQVALSPTDVPHPTATSIMARHL